MTDGDDCRRVPAFLPLSILRDMSQGLAVEGPHVFVVQCIEHMPTFPPIAHPTRLAHIPQLMRDGRLLHPQRGGQIGHTVFPLGQERDNPQAGRIA